MRTMNPLAAAPRLALLLWANAALAQGPAANAASQGPQLASPLFSGLRWRSIGPASIGGRINDIVVTRRHGQPDQLYIAPSGGGVFKSTNAGTSWTPVFDAMNAMMAMGRLAAAPSDPNIIWAGTGEATNPAYRWGDGVVCFEVAEKPTRAGCVRLKWKGRHRAACLELRGWRAGDHYRPAGRTRDQKIQEMFQKARVPSWKREFWPIVTNGPKILWVREFGAAAEFASEDGAGASLWIWEEKSDAA